MTVKGGSRPACAACRFQRRRCSPDCPLAPFFPANQPKIFQNVHRLYGVGNIMKILKQLKDNEQKQEAMKSIKYESYIRQIYRVDGCYGTIICLQQQLVQSMRELQYVRVLLDNYKKNESLSLSSGSGLGSRDDHVNNVIGGSSDWRSEMTMAHEAINNNNNNHHDNYDHDNLGFYYKYDGLSDFNNDNNNNNSISNASEVVKRVMESQPYYDDWDNETKNGVDSVKYRSYLDGFQSYSVEEGEESPDYGEMTCDLFVEDPQSHMESKEAFELSSESFKDTSYFTDPEDTKPNKDLFRVQEGINRLAMEY